MNPLDACIEWLKKQPQRKTINTNHTSYHYKHDVEFHFDHKVYVPHEVFKEAVRLSGIKYRPTSMRNYYLAIKHICERK